MRSDPVMISVRPGSSTNPLGRGSLTFQRSCLALDRKRLHVAVGFFHGSRLVAGFEQHVQRIKIEVLRADIAQVDDASKMLSAKLESASPARSTDRAAVPAAIGSRNDSARSVRFFNGITQQISTQHLLDFAIHDADMTGSSRSC